MKKAPIWAYTCLAVGSILLTLCAYYWPTS